MKPKSPIWCYTVAVLCSLCALPAPARAKCSDHNITPQNFVQSKVSFLSNTFDPKATKSSPTTYISPQCNVGGSSPTAPYSTDLENAFTIAPNFFQNQLCDLTCIFIVQSPCTTSQKCNAQQITNDSWGFREKPEQSPSAGRYIATSQGLWFVPPSGNPSSPPWPAPYLDVYEQGILGALLNWSSNPPTYNASNDSTDPQYSSAMTVLASLAHEFGHVLWYDTFRPVAGGSYDFDTFCDGTFFVRSWRHMDKPPEWRNFGDAQNSHVPSDIDANVVDIALALVNQHPGLAGDLLERIYRSRNRWASLFAAFSPDEDFVETFKFYVMTNDQNNSNPLTSLPITITGSAPSSGGAPRTYNRDIPGDYAGNKKQILSRKIRCFQEVSP